MQNIQQRNKKVPTPPITYFKLVITNYLRSKFSNMSQDELESSVTFYFLPSISTVTTVS